MPQPGRACPQPLGRCYSSADHRSLLPSQGPKPLFVGCRLSNVGASPQNSGCFMSRYDRRRERARVCKHRFVKHRRFEMPVWMPSRFCLFDAPIGIPAITLSSPPRANFHLAIWKLPLHPTAQTFRNMKLRAPHDYYRYLLGTIMNQDPNLHLAIPPLQRSFCLSDFLLRAKSASTISHCGANIL